MANETIAKYLADPSIPVDKRKKIAEGLNSGQLTESVAMQGISAKYGEKYGSTKVAPPGEEAATNLAKGAVQAFNPANFASNVSKIGQKLAEKAPELGKRLSDIGAGMSPAEKAQAAKDSTQREADRNKQVDEMAAVTQDLNKRGFTPKDTDSMDQRKTAQFALKAADPVGAVNEAVGGLFGAAANNTYEAGKTGLIKGGEGIQKVGAAITGDTSDLEGFRSFYGLKSDEQAARDMKQLNPEERGQMAGEGLTNFVSGTVQAASSPLMGVTEAVPGGKEVMGAVNDYVMKPLVQTGSSKFKDTLKAAGIQLNPDQEASIDEGVGNLLNLFMIKSGEDTARAKVLESQKAKLTADIPELIKKGDLEAAKSAMSQYENLLKEKTTITGRVGAAASDGSAIAGKVAVQKLDQGGKIIKEGVTKVVDTLRKDPEKVLDSTIDYGIQKGIKPSVSGKKTSATQEAYRVSSREGVRTVLENKKNLELTDPITGEKIKGELPKSLTQFSEAIQQSKREIYKKYSDLSRKAGEEGAKVSLKTVADELDKIASDQVLQDSNPSAVKYATEKAETLRNRGSYTPEQAEQALKIYNDSLQNFYRNPTPDTYAKAHVDALVANHLRNGLDNVIDSMTGKQYAQLRKQYGALKTIEKDVNHRAVVSGRQNQVGLVDSLTNVASAAEALNGIMHANPQAFATGLVMKGVAKYIKHLNDPNIIVKNMFTKSERLLNKIPAKPLTKVSPSLIKVKTTNPATFKDVFSSEAGQMVYSELKNSEAGKRVRTADGEYTGYKSTFPAWIPDDLKNKKLIDLVVDKLTNNQLISSEKAKALAQVIKSKVDEIKSSTGGDMPF